MALAVEVAGKTDIGCVRGNNEDSFAYDTTTGLFVVCDGMGGAAAGEVASSMAVASLMEFFRVPATAGGYSGSGNAEDRARDLSRAIQTANRQIRQTAAESPSRAGMGSTIVAALLNGSTFTIAHVGDSRIYLIRGRRIRQLTNDHSLVMEEVRSGLLSLEEAHRSELQNIILRALGAKDTVEPDVADIDVTANDILLLTTDGLVRHVDDARILELIQRAPTLEEACEALIASAKAAGGSDNITCLLVKIVEGERGAYASHRGKA